MEIIWKIINGIRMTFAVLFMFSGVYAPFSNQDESILLLIVTGLVCIGIGYLLIPRATKQQLKNRLFKTNQNLNDSQQEFSDSDSFEPVRNDEMEEPEQQVDYQEEISFSGNQQESQNKTESHEIDQLVGLEFENYFINYLVEQGYANVRISQNPVTQGVDILAFQGGTDYLFCCQQSSEQVGEEVIRTAKLAKTAYTSVQVVVISNNYFSAVAEKLASESNIILWNRNQLMSVLKN